MNRADVRITGLVVAAFWDNGAATMRGAIATDHGDDHLVLPDRRGRALVEHFGDRVTVWGQWFRDALGRPSIEVEGFEVLHALDECAHEAKPSTGTWTEAQAR